MDFRILGPLEALDGARHVALGGRKRRAVLAVLLLHPNETLSSERLVDELWGESPPANALKTLQVHVSRLRKELAPGVLVTRDHGYELQLDVDELDAHRFEALVEDSRGELAAGHPDRALAALERAKYAEVHAGSGSVPLNVNFNRVYRAVAVQKPAPRTMPSRWH